MGWHQRTRGRRRGEHSSQDGDKLNVDYSWLGECFLSSRCAHPARATPDGSPSQLYAALAPILAPTDTAPNLLFSFYIQHLTVTLLYIVSIAIHGTSTARWALALTLLLTNLLAIAVTLTFPLESPPSAAELRQREKQAIESAVQAQPAKGVEMGREPLMPTPERAVTLGGWLTFTWAAGLMHLAVRRKVQYPDLWTLPRVMQADVVYRGSVLLK